MKTFKIQFLILASVLLFVSCSDDEDPLDNQFHNSYQLHQTRQWVVHVNCNGEKKERTLEVIKAPSEWIQFSPQVELPRIYKANYEVETTGSRCSPKLGANPSIFKINMLRDKTDPTSCQVTKGANRIYYQYLECTQWYKDICQKTKVISEQIKTINVLYFDKIENEEIRYPPSDHCG